MISSMDYDDVSITYKRRW